MQKGFKTGNVDIGSLGISPIIIHSINSNDFTINDARVGVIAGMNDEGSVLVVANNISSIKDLRGRTVWISRTRIDSTCSFNDGG